MQEPSRSKAPVWLLLTGIVGAGAILWALAPTSRRQQADGDGVAPQASPATSTQADLSRLRRAIEVLSQAHADTDLAGADRRGAMTDLLTQGDAPTRLTLLLEAAAADPSEPDKDPLWRELVGGLSSIWQDDGITTGIDLMFTESRPRARDAVVSSFAKLALERTAELTPPQRQKPASGRQRGDGQRNDAGPGSEHGHPSTGGDYHHCDWQSQTYQPFEAW